MIKLKTKKLILSVFALTIAFAILLTPAPPIDASDHGDGIAAPQDRACDIADIYAFLDPNDNKRVVFVLTLVGFIATSENEAFGSFDPLVRYSFGIENTGDAKPDLFLDVTFTKPTSRALAQTATIKLSHREKGKDANAKSFQAPATLSSAQFVAPPRVLTTDPATGIRFFAGLSDDPFFFDVPAEIFYRDSRFAGTAQPSGFGSIDNPDPSTIDPTVFNRARDSFAGYNVLSIALSVPVDLLKGPAGNILGVYGATARNKRVTRKGEGNDPMGRGEFVQVDGMGTPVVNVVLISPFTDRDRFNNLAPDSSTFANGIVDTLRRLQTRQPGIDFLTQMVVANGDYLRIDCSIPNTGPEGGTNAAAGFPNGRRLVDDTTRLIVSIINNLLDAKPGTNEGDQDDGITKNDEPFLNVFPFVAPSLQPIPDKNVTDDRTRN